MSVLAGPIWYFGVIAYIIASRFTYPFELEWMEGGSLLHLLRLLDGKLLYVPPSLEFTPYLYPPLYYYIALLLSKLTGLTWFEPLRLTSILASLGSGLCILFIVRKQTGSLYWGTLAAGLFAATFRAGGAWFDIARVDMLFVFLMLAGLYVLVAQKDWRLEIASGLIFALAFYAKQTSLPVFAVLLTLLLWARGRYAGLRMGVAFILLTGLFIGIEEWKSQGWYWYYIFKLPASHALLQPLWAHAIIQFINILQPLLIATPISIVGTMLIARKLQKDALTIILAGIASLVVIAFIAGMNTGSYNNAYIPAFAGLSILFGIGGAQLGTVLAGPAQSRLRLVLYAACLLQFGFLYFNVAEQIPTLQDRQANENIVLMLKDAPGEVLIPYHSYMAILAGKPATAHHIALLEIRGAFGETGDVNWSKIEAEIADDIREQRFGLIVLDNEHPVWQAVATSYHPEPILYPNERVSNPVTGAQTRPATIWTPNH
jgi:hypothetical protein